MEKFHLRFALVISCLCLLWIAGLAAIPSKQSLGIAPQDESYYKSNVIKCKDGSKKFTREQLNDDFCDCSDGTDEPGTSACPEGKFYCQNAGHTPLTIFSSRVNDGLCDCCDGSDEYDGKINCPNTCWEAGKAAREKLKKKIGTYQDGVIIRKQEVEKAKQAFAKDEEDLSRLQSEEKILKDLVHKLKEHKDRIEKVEEEERLKKEKEEKKQEEAERKAKEQEKLSEEASRDHKIGVDEESPTQDALKEGDEAVVEAETDFNAETHLSVNHAAEPLVADDSPRSETADHSSIGDASSSDTANEDVAKDQEDTLLEAGDGEHKDPSNIHVLEAVQGSGDISGLSKEELGRLVASRWTGEDAAHKTNEVDSALNDEVHQEIPDSAKDEDYNGYNSETEDNRHKYDDDDDFEEDVDEEYVNDHVDSDESYSPDEDGKTDISDLTDSDNPSWLDKIQKTVQNVLQAFNFFRTPVDISEADRVRKEYDDSKSKLSKIQSRISSLTEKLKHDFGKEKEFYSFYDRCFESKQNKYVYKICPFKQASQVEGHSTTRLGNWQKFEESYRVMEFSNGEKCWNGPDRSINVRLRCGLTNELTDVDEPSRCEYAAVLSTPALCLEEKLKELQEKLEQMNPVQPQGRDEL